MQWFKNRRREAAKALPERSALVLGSFPEVFKEPDVAFPYRQDSDFYYLTGCEEPNSFFILKKPEERPGFQSILCVAKRDPKKEIWEGPRLGPEEAEKVFLMDKTYPASDLDTVLKKYLKGVSLIFYNKINPFYDAKIRKLKLKTRSAREYLAPFRRIKDSREAEFLKQAAEVSAHAHKSAARALRPGVNERALHGVFLKSLMEKGSPREGYPSIAACGSNAVTLHYTKNNSVCKKGELLLLDAGAEVNYYTADITRVYPVSGRFSKSQKNIYEKLLSLQKSLIRAAKPGVSFKDLNNKMFEGVTNILLETRILKGSLSEHLKKKNWLAYCPHSVGHLLGMDVHDPPFSKQEEPLLAPGMTLTIEPGIYIPKEDKNAPAGLSGTGLRIEDNIHITLNGSVTLTSSAPKETEQLERLCSS